MKQEPANEDGDASDVLAVRKGAEEHCWGDNFDDSDGEGDCKSLKSSADGPSPPPCAKGHKQVSCAICFVTSGDAEEWFAYNVVESADGQQCEVPAGDLCWTCGSGCECWPLEDKSAIIAKYHKEPAFWGDFTAVRKGIEIAKQHFIKNLMESGSRAPGDEI